MSINPSKLRLQQLQLMVSLEKTGNLTKSAHALHTTQPALSRWLIELESDLNTKLFKRHARGLVPTPYGEILIKHAHNILNGISRIEDDINAIKQGYYQIISIGTSPASAPAFVPQSIAQFRQQHPTTKIILQENTMDVLLKKLEQSQIDIVIGRMDNYSPRKDIQSELLYYESVSIVLRQGHPLTQKKAIKWDDLMAYDWIVWPKGAPIRSRLDGTISAANTYPATYRMESTSQVANLWLLQNTDMISVMSNSVAELFHEKDLLTMLELPPIGKGNDPHIAGLGAVGMLWNRTKHITTLVHDFQDCLRTIAQQE